jgi:hypothetical protein
VRRRYKIVISFKANSFSSSTTFAPPHFNQPSLHFPPSLLPITMPTSDVPTRALVVGLKSIGKTYPEISELTGVATSTAKKIYLRAVDRGFDPAKRPLEISEAYLADSSRTLTPTPKKKKKKKKQKQAESGKTPTKQMYVLSGGEKKHVLIIGVQVRGV